MKVSTKLWIGTGAMVVVGVGGLAGLKAAQIGSMIHAGKSFAPPPESVTVAKVEASEWQPVVSAAGSLTAAHGVTLGAELPGRVVEIDFDSGATVKRGALLVRLDSTTEEAQLASAEAEAAFSKANLDRSRLLRASDGVTMAELEVAVARAKQADAAVSSLRATIAKKSIHAPFDGRIAIRQVELGQIISPGTPIASLQSVSPIFVDFWVPQQRLAVLKPQQAVRLRTDTFPEAVWDGAISAINPEVDVTTRNVRVRATVMNADGRLRPGMYASVEVVAGEPRPVLGIPVTSVIYAPYGDSVFSLEGDPAGKSVARQRFVRLGERRGDLVAVLSGLTAGESIVSSGAFKLRNGAAVVVKNDLAPTAQLAPQPADN